MNRCMNKLAWNQLKWSYFKMLTFCDACPCCDASSYVSSHLCSGSCSSSVCSSWLCSPVCSRLGSARVTGFEPSWGRKSEPYTGCEYSSRYLSSVCNGWRVLAAGQPPQRGPAAPSNYLPHFPLQRRPFGQTLPLVTILVVSWGTWPDMTWSGDQTKHNDKDKGNPCNLPASFSPPQINSLTSRKNILGYLYERSTFSFYKKLT